MKALLLCAGYATRLYPLTENFPKPLIPINGKPMIDHIMEHVESLGITETYVVTNARFYEQFKAWGASYGGASSITVINDNTTSDKDKLGAIGDIMYAMKEANIDDDLLVLGGDNLFTFSLQKAHDKCMETKKTTVVAYDVKNIEDAKRFGVLDVDANGKVLSFEEKPAQPKSTLCAICVYFYPKEIIPKMHEYMAAGMNPDAPGNLPAWLVTVDEVYCVSYDGPWYDVGSFESLKQAKEDYGETAVDIEQLKQGKL